MKLLAPLKKFILFRCHSTRPLTPTRRTPKEWWRFFYFICSPALVSSPSSPVWNIVTISTRPLHFCRVLIFVFPVSTTSPLTIRDISFSVFVIQRYYSINCRISWRRDSWRWSDVLSIRTISPADFMPDENLDTRMRVLESPAVADEKPGGSAATKHSGKSITLRKAGMNFEADCRLHSCAVGK